MIRFKKKIIKTSRKKWFYTDLLEVSFFFFIDSNSMENISRVINNIKICSNKNNDIYVIDVAENDIKDLKYLKDIKYFKVKGGFEPEKISSLLSNKNIVVGVSSNISLNKNFLDYIDCNLFDNMSFFEAEDIGKSIFFISCKDILCVKKYYKDQTPIKSFMKVKNQRIPRNIFNIHNLNFKKKVFSNFKVFNKNGKQIDLYNNKIINSMWIGDDLSNVEKLSINSFLKNGHDFHLYVYDDIKGIPDGVVVKDANSILDRSNIFKFKSMLGREGNEVGNEGFSGFADWFRYVLIHKKGGWWSDLDSICLKKFDIFRPYFFTTMNGKGSWVTNGIFKTPKNSLVMLFCMKYCESVGKDAEWLKTGPSLLYKAYNYYNLDCFGKTKEVFDVFKGGQILFQDKDLDLGEAYSVHMYNSHLEKAGKNKNGTFPKNSFFEKMKRKYL